LTLTKLLIPFGRQKNCLQNGSQLLHLFIRSFIKQTSNYRKISLSTTYKILSITFLSRLTLYAHKITRDHQGGFQHNRLTTEQTCILHLKNTSGRKKNGNMIGQCPVILPFVSEVFVKCRIYESGQ
jgi:hypothetical protein